MRKKENDRKENNRYFASYKEFERKTYPETLRSDQLENLSAFQLGTIIADSTEKKIQKILRSTHT